MREREPEFAEIPRSRIETAAYNPRMMDPEARKRLRQSLAKFGLVEPLVWNRKTGRLVGGHQRLEELDTKEGYPGRDYLVSVSVVEFGEKKERQANVWLNNPSSQGNFERDKFLSILSGADPDQFGFSSDDLAIEFNIELPEAPKPQAVTLADQPKRPDPKPVEATDTDFVLICFPSRDKKAEWLREQGFPEHFQAVSIEEMTAALNIGRYAGTYRITAGRRETKATGAEEEKEVAPDSPDPSGHPGRRRQADE